MAQLAQKIPVLAGKLLAEAKPRLNTFIKYAKVELTPPTPADIPQIRAGIGRLLSGAKNGNWKNVTVRDGSGAGSTLASALENVTLLDTMFKVN